MVELLLEVRLLELGYRSICKAGLDCGVDRVVWSSKGWVGIQVKCANLEFQRKYKRKTTGNVGRKRKWADKRPCASIAASSKKQSGKSYYQENGVSVIAAFWEGSFYMIPIGLCGENSVFLDVNERYREAFHEVLGTPKKYLEHSERASSSQSQLFIMEKAFS